MIRLFPLAMVALLVQVALAAPIEPMHTLQPVKQQVTGIAFSPDNKTLAVSCADSSLRLITIARKTEIAKFDVSAGANCLRFSPDGRYLMAIVNNGVASLDVQNKKVKHVFAFDAAGGVSAIDVSPDGKFLAAVGKGALSVWNIETGVNLATVDAHAGSAIHSVAFSPEGNLIATAGNDRKIITWNTTTLQPQKEIDLAARALGVQFLPRSNHLLAACDDRTIRKLNASSGEDEQLVSAAAKALVLSPDRPLAILQTGGRQPGVLLIEKRKLSDVTITGHQSAITAVSMSRDGRFFASGDQSGAVNIYATLDVAQ